MKNYVSFAALEKYSLFLALAFISEIIGTVTGFGSSILFVPLASLFFDFKTVLGITAVFHVFSNLSKITLFRKGVSKEIVLKLGVFAVVFVSIGAVLTAYLPTDLLALIMNIALILLALFLLLNGDKQLKRTNRNLYLGGILSGLLAGVAGTGGAIRGLTLAAFQLPKDMLIATSAVIDLGVDLSRAGIYLWHDYLDEEYFILIPSLIVIGFLGSWLGKKILHYVSEKLFRYLLLSIIILSSVIQLIQYLSSPIQP